MPRSLFIRNGEDPMRPDVRQRVGERCGLIGIILNALLSSGKFLAGALTGSVAITADAVNNLSDAGTSIISFASARISGKPADKEHPFGHERIEYLASLAVGIAILFLGIGLIKSSIDKIKDPSGTAFSWISVGILLAGIATKLGMFFLNRRFAKKTKSPVLKATSIDSISDVAATSAVLLSTLISRFTGVNLDGFVGILVALFVIYSVVDIFKDSFNRLLGYRVDSELYDKVNAFLCSYDGVLGSHDLVIHSYGPNRFFASAHVEISADRDILISHDLIDGIERECENELNVHMVLHLDPVVTDGRVSELKEKVKSIASAIDPALTVHDFRAVFSKTHTNLIFDVVLPDGKKLNEDDVLARIQSGIKQIDETYYAVITLDRSFTSRTTVMK